MKTFTGRCKNGLTRTTLFTIFSLSLSLFFTNAFAQSGQNCFSSNSNPNNVWAYATYTTNPANQTVTIRVTFSKGFVDNTYGTNAIGWPGGHSFSNLTGSDNLGWALKDANGTVRLQFKQDYISASNLFPSGYGTLGFDGDGDDPTIGNASDVVAFKTSLDQNFNDYGYVLTTNSPATDNNYSPNPAYPNWIYDVWYEVTVNQSAFGPAGFGSVNIASVHASPSKTGNNTEIVIPVPCVGSIGDFVWYDNNGNGVQDAGEAGIPGVTVTLTKPDNSTVTTTTNATGYYQFSNLTAGNYTVSFPTSLAGGYGLTISGAGSDGTKDSNPNQGSGISSPISLGPNINNMTVDAGYVLSNLSLGNKVYLDVNRNGMYDAAIDGNIQNATVKLYNDVNNDNIADGSAIRTTTTDLTGTYSFNNLGPGNYIVGVVMPSPYGMMYINGGDPDNDIDHDNSGLSVSGSETRGRSITLTNGGEPTGGSTNNTYDFGFYNPQIPPDGGGNCFSSASGNPNVFANSFWTVDAAANTVTVRVVFSKGFVDNTYGTNAVGWPGGHSFSNLTGSDRLEWSLRDANGTERLRFEQDYISSSNMFPSGYGTLGFDGDGDDPSVGNPSDVLSFRTSLSENFNTYGYVLTQNSPATDANYTPNPQYPNWIYDVWYEVTVKNSAFGQAGFGSVNVASVHASPSKTGNNTEILIDAPCNNACIGDRVWLDVNQNGIQDAGEVGVSGIVVTLFNDNGTVSRSTITDAYGVYKFCGLETGTSGKNYQVRVSLPPGYMFSPQNADNTGISGQNNSDVNPTTGRTGNVMVSGSGSSANVMYVDAGIIATPASCIGDFIWNDLNKNGVQDAGEPGIAGVTLTLYNNGGNVVYTTITDNNGHYTFCDLTPGSYTVGVSVPPGYQYSPQDQGGNDNTDSDVNPQTGRTSTITVTSSSNLTIDIGLNTTPSSKAAIGDYVWNDINGNHLQDMNEPGVPNITVQLYNSSNVLIATTTTNSFGYYIFNDVNPGNYYVKFSNLPSGYIYAMSDVGTNDYKDSDVTHVNGTGSTATFSVIADNIYTQYDAGIRNTSILNSIGDYVWYDLDKDGIQDANEAGVPGVSVTLYNASTGSVVGSTSTNGSGMYLFTDLPSGTYYVGFSNLAVGYAFSPQDQGENDAIDSDVNPGSGQTNIISIVGNGNFITTVDAGIISNPNTFDTKGTIGDYVWNDLNNNGIQDSGEPGMAGVTVTLYGADGISVLGTTTTNALGYYQFSNLMAGTYTVGFSNLPSGFVFGTANAGSDDSKDSDANPGTGKSNAVTLSAGQINTTIDAAIRNSSAGSSLGNFVWNDLNGNGHQDAGEPGIPGISVQLLNNSNTVLFNTVTDINGFYIFNGLSAGTYKLRFGNLPAGFEATTANALPANDATDSDAEGTGLVTTTISLAANSSDMSWDFGARSTTTGSIGDYVWNDANNNGLQDSNEHGIAGILVTLYNCTGTAISSAVTDANGKYLFVNVAAGCYTIGFSGLPSSSTFTVKDAGLDTGDSDANPLTGRTDQFTVVAGQSNTTIDAGLVTKFAGVGNYAWKDVNGNGIQDANEPPMAGITVILYNSNNQPVASAVTDGNGFYFINNIPVNAACELFTIVFTDKPVNTFFTIKNAGGSTPETDSDAGVQTGRTDGFILCPGVVRMDIDAGIIPSSPSTLPVQKLDLFVTLENSISKLKWVTLDELNTDHFIIERSLNGTDFTGIANTGAAGNYNGLKSYFLDDNISLLMQNPVIYYRVKLVNIDNSVKYSQVVTVRLSQKNMVTVWPNPFSSEVRISYISQGSTTVKLRMMDNSGKLVSQKSYQVVNGMNQLSVQNLGSLPAGIYIMEITNPVNGSVFTHKLVKE